MVAEEAAPWMEGKGSRICELPENAETEETKTDEGAEMGEGIVAAVLWTMLSFGMGHLFAMWQEGRRRRRMRLDKIECYRDHEAGVWIVTDGNGVVLEDEDLLRALERMEKAQEEIAEETGDDGDMA